VAGLGLGRLAEKWPLIGFGRGGRIDRPLEVVLGDRPRVTQNPSADRSGGRVDAVSLTRSSGPDSWD
jgi:hypothetical protein